jgi:hypothetical protein
VAVADHRLADFEPLRVLCEFGFLLGEEGESARLFGGRVESEHDDDGELDELASDYEEQLERKRRKLDGSGGSGTPTPQVESLLRSTSRHPES